MRACVAVERAGFDAPMVCLRIFFLLDLSGKEAGVLMDSLTRDFTVAYFLFYYFGNACLYGLPCLRGFFDVLGLSLVGTISRPLSL